MRSRSFIAAAALAGLAALPSGSDAQSAAPTPCVGYAVEDPTGDAFYGLAGNFSPVPADPVADITGIFFRTVGTKSTLNVQVAELTENAPATSNGIEFRTIYTNPADNFLDITLPPSGAPTFSYGHFEDTGPVSDGETGGKLYPGPNGVIEVTLPKGYGKAERVSAYTFSSYNLGAVLASTDDAPDGSAADNGASNYDYNGASCDGDGGDPGTGGGGGTTPPPGANTPLGELSIKATPTTVKRKKAKKGKRLRFTLESSERVTDLSVSLNKGTKSLGKATLATLEGKTPVKVKLKKSLKKGKYQLVFNGTRSDGSKAADAVALKVK